MEKKVRQVKHGMTGTRFYSVWDNMKQRCTNPNSSNYKNYGGRGITICEEWHTFIGFRDDLLESYEAHAAEHGEKNTTLDRINNEKGYYPDNCRWVTNQQQAVNKRLSSANSTGYTGVSFDKRIEKYEANISIDGKKKTIGYFKELIDAVKARRAYEAGLYNTIQMNGQVCDLNLLVKGFYAKEGG